MSRRTEGKIAIVTGAASGVGKEDALLLAREGARVVLTDLNEEAGHALAREIGETALFVPHDIASEAGWQQVMARTAQRFGAPNVLVNNAAILMLGSVEDATLEQWQRVMRINADGYFLGCKYGVAAMKAGGGSIVNMSSVAALGGMGAFCAYSASKGAVAALTRAVAGHCKQSGYRIRCNSIHPDGILTPMTAAFLPGGAAPLPEDVGGAEPMQRMCHPRDVANLVLFLASDEARFINGAELRIDNAQTIMGVA
ncbi:SDR family oxidoreductase [Cupriavidus necator]|uniref:SDR family oxidoreductase n=1 Tax=Cupriavidus necator TaxID=106590 RepID=UPI002785704E|nr:SDR family oxidoreductase [Cupriavidus necator]MDQ0140526.1 3(or 17)beta-hydroxysteroid dehydrogenase [Cupriavidus necator]